MWCMLVGRELNPFLGTFWGAWRLFIWVGSLLQNLFWSLFDLSMMIQICYDHTAFWSFGVFFFHFFSSSNFHLSFYSFFCLLFSNGHLLCNIFLLSHWLLVVKWCHFLGTFWRAWMLFILVGRPLQNLFWSLFDLFVMIPICYDPIALANFRVFFFHFFSTSSFIFNFCKFFSFSYVYCFPMVICCVVSFL